jgi:DNA-binding SARP family transcriptional activator
MTSTYQIRLLGPVAIEHTSQPWPTCTSRKALALLGYLIRQNQPVARSQLVSLFWGEISETSGRHNLTRELSRLTAALPGCFSADYHAILWTGGGIAWVDTLAFLALVRGDGAGSTPAEATEANPVPSDAWFAPQDASIHPAHLAEAVALYRSDFLSGVYLDHCPDLEIWLIQEREFWRQQVTKALDSLIAYHALRHEDDKAQAYARCWLTLEPWNEDPHRYLLILLARNNKRSAALAQYATCRRVLAKEFGVEPAEETVALYEQIRAGALSGEAARQQGREDDLSRLQSRTVALPPTEHRPGCSRPQRHDWGEALSTGIFYERQAELAALEQWLVGDCCRIVAVFGMGGMGKTMLAVQLARQLADHFDSVIWRSLRNRPPLTAILRGATSFLSGQAVTELPESLDEQIARLLDQLRQQRCLLVLDQFEGILQECELAGAYCPGYADYAQLIQHVGETEHQSCLFLISREQPREFTQLHANTLLVQSLQLAGLDGIAGQQLLQTCGCDGPAESRATLIERYSGNPLALTLVAVMIAELFAGDVAAFLREDVLIFDAIRTMLDQQFARLTPLELELLCEIASARPAPTPAGVGAHCTPTIARRVVLEALRSLQRRSLLELQGQNCTVQHIVTEYVKELLMTGAGKQDEQ